MPYCPIFSVIGTITAIGANNPDNGGVVYHSIEISEQRGRTRRLTAVRAVEELASLVEQHAIGMFVFWERQGERRLWCVDRADGPRQVDFEAMRAYFQQTGCRHAPT
jgi:hypothetical protein